jgi:hypothetical protein
MALRIRRGTDAQRTGKTFEVGEIVYTTDLQQVWMGNGVTAGGIPVVGSNVAGFGLAYDPTSKKIGVSGLTTDSVTQGTNNKYFSTELAVDSVGAALVAGNPSNVGITFTYAQTQDDAGRINATVDASAFVGIATVSADTSPELGGNLDLNTFDISGTGDINISGTINSTGLGGDLDLNEFDINGLGNVSITGYVSDSVISSVNGTTRSVTSIGTALKPVELTVTGFPGAAISILGVSQGGAPSLITFKHSNGSYAIPTITANDDLIGAVEFQARNATGYIPSSIMAVLVTDSSIANNSTSIDSTIFIGNTDAVLGGTGACLSVGPTGIVSAPIFKVSDVAGTLPSAPQAGMIVLDGATFKGYNGTAWVNLN